MAPVPGSSFFKEPVNHLIRMHFARGTDVLDEAVHRLAKLTELLKYSKFAFLMHKQQPQTAYRKDAVLTGTIFENCDKKEDITRFFA